MSAFILAVVPLRTRKKNLSICPKARPNHISPFKGIKTRIEATQNTEPPYISSETESPPNEGEIYDNESNSYQTIDASVTKVPLEELKLEFLRAVTTVNRGFAAPPATREQILALVEQIERENPTTCPSKSDLLIGEWRLLYTNALDVLSLGLLAPIALVSEVYQNVAFSEKDDYCVTNIVNLEPSLAPITNSFFGRTMASILVTAAGVINSDTRIDIRFTAVRFKPTYVIGFDIPDRFSLPSVKVGSPTGYIDTTFLDDDLRIARAPPGIGGQLNLFVLERVQT